MPRHHRLPASRSPLVLLSIAAALAAGGCASAGPGARAAAADPQPVRLGGGDSVGRQLVREVPEFAIACTTPHSDIASVNTDLGE